MVGDERAPRVVDVDHGARVALQRGGDRVHDRGMDLAALAHRIRNVHDRRVHLVGDVEHVAVGDMALDRIVVEQRPMRVAAQDERQLPGQVVAVVQARVEPFAAERARQVGGVADQEPPAVRQARHHPPVHPERREPGDVGGPIFPAEPCLDPGDDVLDGYALDVLLEVLEADPASAGEWREQQQAIRRADDAGLVARERRRHRDVGDEEMSSVGGALERLAHRMARDAVRTARPDGDARADRLRPTVRVDELDDDPVRVRLDRGRRDPAFDHAAERREMGFEDALGLVLRQAELELAAAVDALVAHGGELHHARAVQARAPDLLGDIEKRLQQPDGIQNLERPRLDRRGTRLAVRPHVALDEPRARSVAGELGRGEQPGRPSADDQDIVAACHSISPNRALVG